MNATLRSRLFANDLRAYLALSDARKAENAESRRRCLADTELCAALLEAAHRRGERAVDWSNYFRAIGI